jgi:CRP-like cAMP-binding protein
MSSNISKLIETSLNLINIIDAKLKFTIDEKQYLNSVYEKEIIKRNDYILKQGEEEEYIYFVERGLFRYWAKNYKNTEITFYFSFDGEFISPNLSTNNNVRSKYNIQALVNSTIWKIKKEYIFNSYPNNLNSNKIARIILENALTRKVDRELFLLQNNPEQRYTQLMKKERKILLNVPLKYIASYLGITPQTLSVIRKRVYKRRPV